MNVRIACLAILFVGSVCAAERPASDGAQPGRWTMDFDAAKQVAAEKKLPVLLNFTGSDWCGACKLMDKEVFSKPAWTAYATNTMMLVWIDFPGDPTLVPEKYVSRNADLDLAFGVEGKLPTYILLDDDGQTELGRLAATRETTAASFIAEINILLQERATVIDAWLKTLSAETAREYRDTAKALAAAKKAFTALQLDFKNKSATLGGQITQQAGRLATIRLDSQLAKIPEADATAYREKQARRAAAESELTAWMKTRPEKNASNTRKFTGWRDEITQLDKDMQALLPPAK
jgi:thiol-disulfide isomerase/thioredoxin